MGRVCRRVPCAAPRSRRRWLSSFRGGGLAPHARRVSALWPLVWQNKPQFRPLQVWVGARITLRMAVTSTYARGACAEVRARSWRHEGAPCVWGGEAYPEGWARNVTRARPAPSFGALALSSVGVSFGGVEGTPMARTTGRCARKKNPAHPLHCTPCRVCAPWRGSRVRGAPVFFCFFGGDQKERKNPKPSLPLFSKK